MLGRALADQGLFVEIAAGAGAATVLFSVPASPYAEVTRSLPSTFPLR